MAHKPLLRHQHVHHSCTTINDLITSYYHTILEPEPQIIPLLLSIGLETHTFHLPWGECTITLDVALHLGIRVDGHIVIGPNELYDELLGEVPPKNASKGAALKLTWLLSILHTSLPKEPTIHQLQCRCKTYTMFMIGGALIPDKSGNRVHLIYLNLLRDFNNIKNYSWDSTCLANLYRELCRAPSKVGRVMGGCAILLQSWAWYHMSFIAPRNIRPDLMVTWSCINLVYIIWRVMSFLGSHIEDLKNTYRDMHIETKRFGLHVLQLFGFQFWNDIKQIGSSYNLDYNKISLLIL
ncbi:Serine/threonine-protein phosphatase 7 long form [Glycine soja]